MNPLFEAIEVLGEEVLEGGIPMYDGLYVIIISESRRKLLRERVKKLILKSGAGNKT